MAAPAGYRVWSTSDLVSAADFSTYVQDQICGVYSSDSNRSSELAAPAEGQISYLSDTKVFSIYSGSAWVDVLDVDTISVTSGNYAMTGTLTLNSGSDTFSFPTDRGTDTYVLQSDGDGTTSWVAATSGDVTGVTAGNLLDGGGTSGDLTLDVDLSEAATSTTDGDGDFFIVVDASNGQHKLTKANIALSGMNNDSGWTANAGTVTSVTGTAPISSTGGATPAISVDPTNAQFVLSAQVFSG